MNLGKDEQPYPIPIVKRGARWRFDPSEGPEDLLSRRMSKAELSAVNVVLAYVEAQREYHQQDRNGDGVMEYAQKLRSTPGQRDGLAWEGQAGKSAGPLAGLAAAAAEEGYQGLRAGELPIYRGYAYKILTAQGPHASGGAREYVVNGRMTEGFALVAFPLRYGVSGVMTFLANQDGAVYQKDLGPKTVELGQQMTQFDPDQTWTKGQKYMRFMMTQFYENEPMDRLNKGLFTFASYNAGPGRLQQLRKQAAKRGLDPNVWFNNVELLAAEKIGRETVTYVANIYKYYLAYRMIEEERAEREKAKGEIKQQRSQ